MKLGLYLRNMGPGSTRDTILECARIADSAGVDDLWVADHVAIPPDQAEGSGGRYLDPLATLAFVAGATARVGLGTGVLVLPYRPRLATAKWLATIQEISGNRLRLGVGAGWMEAEFRALGVSRPRRGAVTDETLEFLHRAFAADEIEENGQRFLFLPRPPRPPIYVGGASPAARARAARYGDGWMPTIADPQALAPAIAGVREQAARAGKSRFEVTVLTSLPLGEPERTVDLLGKLAAAGVTGVVHAERYADAHRFAEMAETLVGRIKPAL